MKSNYNINRGDFNFLPSIRNPPSKAASLSTNTSKGATNISGGIKGKNKFQSMSKLIVSKIDDLLEQYPNGKAASNSILPYADVYSNAKNLISNLDEKNLKLDLDLEENTSAEKFAKEKEKEISKPKKKKKPTAGKKDTFMTNIELEENIQPPVKQTSRYIEEQDKKIKEMIDDFDDIDNFLNEDEERDYLSSHPEHRDEVMYFKNLINEVDSYRKNVKEEYDELQYLIKFVEDTRGRLNRHKNGVSNLFNQIGIKSGVKNKESSDDEDDRKEPVYYDEGNYDRRKNISKVKDNLINLQGRVINYYQNFNENMKYVERANKETYRSNREVYRAATSEAKLRGKSKHK